MYPRRLLILDRSKYVAWQSSNQQSNNKLSCETTVEYRIYVPVYFVCYISASD